MIDGWMLTFFFNCRCLRHQVRRGLVRRRVDRVGGLHCRRQCKKEEYGFGAEGGD